MSQAPVQDRVLALAGLAQSIALVRRLADSGQADTRAMDGVIPSLFKIDSESTEDVYGSAANVRPGLMRLREQLDRKGEDPQFPKLVMAVMALENSFSRELPATTAVRRALEELAPQAQSQGWSQPGTLRALAGIYANHVSPLTPKIMVQGNPHYLDQAGVVAEIRAMLLSSLRSAVLWRQLGGSSLDFVLQRGAMRQAIGDLA